MNCLLAQMPRDVDGLIALVIVVITVVSFLWNIFSRVVQKPARRQLPGERPLQAQGPEQNAPPQENQAQAKLNAEIEEFLRRANERREEKGRRGKAPAQQPSQRRRPGTRRDSENEARSENRETVEQSVAQHLGTSRFDRREEHLADDVSRSEHELSEHVQHVFDHQLGSLARSNSEGESGTGEAKGSQSYEQRATGMALAGLLLNQENLRQAVILREILERPVDRW